MRPAGFTFDDSGESAQARLPSVTLKQDGKYLVVLGSWDDPGGDGSFSVTASCKGTEFQCRRPVTNTNCTPTWNDCNVVLLEEVHVAPGAVLTIAPGVTVKGNYIGTGPFGNVSLVVDGTLQAVGTKENPVVFTALTTGWAGVVLKGASSSLEHVFIEKAQRGVVVAGSNTTIKNANINSGELGIRFDANSKDNKLGTTQQVDTLHTSGRLNISSNYWAKISDPELSTSWLATHSRPVTCTPASGNCNSANCGSSYSCANNQYVRNGQYQYWNCSAQITATWTGQLTFTGFSPTELPAGPRKEDLCDIVQEERSAQSQ